MMFGWQTVSPLAISNRVEVHNFVMLLSLGSVLSLKRNLF